MYPIHYKQNEKYGLISIALFIAYYTLKVVSIPYIKLLLGLAIAMSVVHILVNVKKATRLSLVILAGIALVILMHMTVSGDMRILIMLFVILDSIYTDLDDLITWMFYSKLIFFPIAFLLGGYSGNPCSLHAGVLILLYLCMNRKHIERKHLVIALILAMMVFLYTGTGALLISVAVATILLSYYVIFGKTKVFNGILIKYIFPLALIANVICVIVFADGHLPLIGQYLPEGINAIIYKIVTFVDIATSHRIALAATSWPVFGVSLLGGNVDYSLLDIPEGVYFYLDSGMMWLLQDWGIIATIVFMIFTIWVMNYLVKNEEYILIISGVIIALWAINEDLLLSVDTNFMIALFGNAIIAKRNLMRVEI